MPPKVVFTDHTFDSLEIEQSVLGEEVELIDGERDDCPIEELVTGADGILVMFDEITESVIERAEQCEIIARTGIGLDNVAIDAATENDVMVTNVDDYCIEEVATHAMGMLLALERKLMLYTDQVTAGDWDVNEGQPMRRLSTQTLGLVGFGNIAQAVNERAAAFGMDVLAYDPYLDAEEISSSDAEPVDDFHSLLERADAISLHTPLTSETEGLIGEEQLAMMDNSTHLINVARGGLIDEDALASASVGGIGLDTRESEPPDSDSPLHEHDNVVLSPHAAWHSVESVKELRKKAAQNVREALDGETPSYLVNTEVSS
jgi:D-3-phosphoglycerate dehydrogenase